MSTEPFDVTDLDQLSEVIVTVTIPLPDGRSANVKLRTLTPGEIREIRRKIPRPKPPVKDYKKVSGEALPVYDYDDAEYMRLDEEYDLEFSRQMLAASLVMNIDGATLTEKSAALEKKLGQAAYTFLINAVNRINNPQAEDIATMLRSFRRNGDVGAAGNGQAVAYSERVEKLIESRSLGNDGLPAGAKRKTRTTD